MSLEQVIGSAIGIILLLFAVTLILVRTVANDWIQWRTRIEGKIDKMDPERMDEHYTKVHTLSNKTFELSMTTSRLDVDQQDHEMRLRLIERKVGVP